MASRPAGGGGKVGGFMVVGWGRVVVLGRWVGVAGRRRHKATHRIGITGIRTGKTGTGGGMRGEKHGGKRDDERQCSAKAGREEVSSSFLLHHSTIIYHSSLHSLLPAPSQSSPHHHR